MSCLCASKSLFGTRCASLDGDADRLVYFTQHDGIFQLFDGDRIAVLAALLVRDILSELQLPADPIKVNVPRSSHALLKRMDCTQMHAGKHLTGIGKRTTGGLSGPWHALDEGQGCFKYSVCYAQPKLALLQTV